MPIRGKCPNCGYEKASFLNIGKNGNVAVSCPPRQGCNFEAATPLENAVKLIESEQFPIQLSSYD